ncbi:MAG: hypothetical protein QXX17_06275 [Conexivisphaerales archaeon]
MEQTGLLAAARQSARELVEQGRALTPIIGELCFCDLMNLCWSPWNGFNVISRSETKYQIKARRPKSHNKLRTSARMGKFRKKATFQFDVDLFVALDPQWEVTGIWRLSRKKIMELKGKKPEESGIHLGTFRRECTLVWQSKEVPQ